MTVMPFKVCLLDAVADGAEVEAAEPRDIGRCSDGHGGSVVVTVESAGGSSDSAWFNGSRINLTPLRLMALAIEFVSSCFRCGMPAAVVLFLLID